MFADLVDWSIVDRRGFSPYRYNEREVVRAWAENCPATRQFLMDNHVRFARINGTHSGGGLSRASRFAFSVAAFNRVSNYDGAISDYLSGLSLDDSATARGHLMKARATNPYYHAAQVRSTLHALGVR